VKEGHILAGSTARTAIGSSIMHKMNLLLKLGEHLVDRGKLPIRSAYH